MQAEDALAQAVSQLQQVGVVAQEGQKLFDLITNPQNFAQFTQVFVEQMLKVEGGVDILDAVLSQVSGAPTMRQQQQAMQQQPQQVQAPAQPTTYGWGDGRTPSSWSADQVQRPNFPGQPGGNGGGTPSLDGVPPDQLWQAVDHLERNGGFRRKVLVQE